MTLDEWLLVLQVPQSRSYSLAICSLCGEENVSYRLAFRLHPWFDTDAAGLFIKLLDTTSWDSG